MKTLMRIIVPLTIALLALPVRAEEEAVQPPAHLASLSDEEVSARLDYLIEHLDYRRQYASNWWRGWTAFYALGVVVQSTRAGLENDESKQADFVVSAVKAVGGTINLLRHPLAFNRGADAVHELPNDTREDRLARLTVAEETLHKNAKSDDRRFWWFPHAMNVGVNAAGAAIIHTVWEDPKTAWTSAGIGIAVGEIMLWSHPWWYRKDWDEYERRFSQAATQPRVSWLIVPTLNGAALHARF